MADTTESTPVAEEQKKPRAGEIGRTGTVNTGGWITGTETNSDLMWPQSLNVYSNMYRTEVAVKAMISYVTLPMRAAEWSPQPTTDEPIDEEIAQFCRAAMSQIEGGWDDFMRRFLSFMRMGFYVGEKVWDYKTVEYGDVKREAFVITKIADRLQRTITKWHDDNGRGPLTEIEQWLGDGHAEISPMLPRDKCVLIVNEQEGSDYFGNSILRSAYGAFTLKRKLETIEAIGIERSIGVVVAYTPESADDTVLDAVEEQLEKLHQAESMYIVAPGKKQQSGDMGGGGWLFETIDVKGDAGTAKANEAIQRYTTELAQNVLAEFMRLGHNNTGARATGDTQSNPYMDAVKAVAKQVGDVLRNEYLEPMVRLNFGPDAKVPELDAVGLEKVDVGALADAFSKFATAGGITVTAKDENWVRGQMGLPEIDEDERDEIQQEKIAQAQAAMQQADPNADNSADPKAKDKGSFPQKGAQAPKSGDKGLEKAHDTFSAGRTPEFVPRRELRGAEVYVAWDVIDKGIDSHRSEFAMAGTGPVARYIDTYVAEGKANSAELIAALERELIDTAEFGAGQVVKELDRQKTSGVATFESIPSSLPPNVLAEIKRRARLAGESVVATVAVAVKRAQIDFLRRRGSGTIDAPVRDAGLEAARVALRGEALENVTATLNLGRDAQAKREGVTTATLSSVLDSGTCEPCAGADGTETSVGSPTYDQLSPPLADCQGANRCRCIYVYTGNESV